jgi:hypothetical protein
MADEQPDIAEQMAKTVKAFVAKAIQPLEAQIDALKEAAVASVEVLAIDERNFEFVLKNAKGAEMKFPFSFALPIYRGVYREGMSAKKGDCFTHQGSLWIAKEDTPVKPGANESWQLAVKRGQDAPARTKEAGHGH